MVRAKLKKTENNELIIDAYNANPSSMKVALDNFATMPVSPKALILGDMRELGPTSDELHTEVVARIKEGNFFWNAGIFVWNVRTITSVMRVYAPGIAQIFDRIFPDFYTEKEYETIKKLFPTCESISIDYAVMEKAEAIYVLPASFGWSDLGTWGALRGLLPQDKSGNATVGTDIRLYDSKNCIVHASEEKRVVVQGLDGYIIAEKDNTLLICKLEEEQRIKEFSK